MMEGYVRVYRGCVCWGVGGRVYRTTGPTIVGTSGDKQWWLNSRRHRIDGPAIVSHDGREYWYLNGIRMTEKEFNERSKAWKDM